MQEIFDNLTCTNRTQKLVQSRFGFDRCQGIFIYNFFFIKNLIFSKTVININNVDFVGRAEEEHQKAVLLK